MGGYINRITVEFKCSWNVHGRSSSTILIESQWNLNYNAGSTYSASSADINRITVEFKFMLCLLSNIRKSDINRITVEFK